MSGVDPSRRPPRNSAKEGGVGAPLLSGQHSMAKNSDTPLPPAPKADGKGPATGGGAPVPDPEGPSPMKRKRVRKRKKKGQQAVAPPTPPASDRQGARRDHPQDRPGARRVTFNSAPDRKVFDPLQPVVKFHGQPKGKGKGESGKSKDKNKGKSQNNQGWHFWKGAARKPGQGKGQRN